MARPFRSSSRACRGEWIPVAPRQVLERSLFHPLDREFILGFHYLLALAANVQLIIIIVTNIWIWKRCYFLDYDSACSLDRPNSPKQENKKNAILWRSSSDFQWQSIATVRSPRWSVSCPSPFEVRWIAKSWTMPCEPWRWRGSIGDGRWSEEVALMRSVRVVFVLPRRSQGFSRRRYIICLWSTAVFLRKWKDVQWFSVLGLGMWDGCVGALV